AVLTDGIIADQRNGARRPEAAQDEARQQGSQTQTGPHSLGQNAVVARRGALPQEGDGAQQVANGASAGGENGGDGQQLGAVESGRGEGGGEQGEDGQGVVGYTGHGGLLARCRGWSGNPMIPHRRPPFCPSTSQVVTTKPIYGL